MIGIGIALLLVGIIFLFVIPWVGIPVGIVGLVLARPLASPASAAAPPPAAARPSVGP